VEGGLPALGLWVSLLFITIARGGRFAIKGAMSPEAAAAAASVAGVAAYSTLNFAISVPADLFYWFACMGLAVSVPAHKDVLEPSRPAGYKTALPLIIGGCCALVFGLNVARVNSLLEKADKLQSELRWEQSLEVLGTAIREEPRRAELYVRRAKLEQRLAVVHADRQDDTLADGDLKKALALDPHGQETLFLQSDFLRHIGDYEGAEKALETAATYAPYRDEILQTLLLLHMLENKPKESLETLKQLASRDPARKKSLGSLLRVVEKVSPGTGSATIEQWARNPEDKALAFDAGREAVDELLAENRPKTAEPLLRSLDRIEPNDTGILLCRAQAEEQSGHRSEALALLETLLSQTQEQSFDDYAKGLILWSHLITKKHASSQVALRLAEYLNHNPAQSGVRVALAEAYLSMHQTEQARVLLDEGLQQDPDNAVFLARRGKIYQKDGSVDMAAQYYRRCLQRDPQNAEAIRGLKSLGQL
jgi:Tfp pilus assembly protein PilF